MLNQPIVVHDKNRVNFLSELSKLILDYPDIRQYPDVATFGFWCRKSNLNKIFKNFTSKQLQVGLGLVYHNSPSNVPVNFAFSLAFGLLSGNSNVVRLSSKESTSTDIIVHLISRLLASKKYINIRFVKEISFYQNEFRKKRQ